MCVSSILLVALTGLVANTTAETAETPGPGDDEDRRLLKTTDEQARQASIFEKLGFCNTRTLRGRYTFFSNGFANISPEFGDPGGPEDVGPLATSGSSYYDGKGTVFSQVVVRSDMGIGALGPVGVLDVWGNYEVLKNCSQLLQASVARFRPTALTPELIIPATTLFVEGNVAPDGSDSVFTIFDTERVVAFSGDQKQVAKFAIPPENFENPPRLPTCFASQSCSSQYEGEPCQQNKDCRIACFPECGMTCTRTSPLGGKACERSF